MDEKKVTSVHEELSWRAAERNHVEKGFLWYAIVGVAALLLVVLALFQKNFFFAVFIIIAAVMAFSLGRTKPNVLEFRIADEGIQAGERNFYPFQKLDGFAIIERPGRLHAIILKRKTTFNPIVKIPVDALHAERAKRFLKGQVPEMEYREPVIDMISDWLGF